MASTNTAVTRLASALSSFQNGFSMHSKGQARLNAVASYDQSNELYMVSNNATYRPSFILTFVKGLPE